MVFLFFSMQSFIYNSKQKYLRTFFMPIVVHQEYIIAGTLLLSSRVNRDDKYEHLQYHVSFEFVVHRRCLGIITP